MNGIRVPIEVSRPRIEECAEQASAVGARLAAEALETATSSLILARREGLAESVDNHGRRLTWEETAPIERSWFDEQGEFTLVVEEEWADKGDPHQEDAAFIGDAVVRWAESSEGYEPLRRFIQRASSGIFTMAYLCRATPASIGLTHGHELDAHEQDDVCGAAFALLNTVFDGEAFLITQLRVRALER